MKIMFANWIISVIIFLLSSSVFIAVLGGVIAMLITPSIFQKRKQRTEI